MVQQENNQKPAQKEPVKNKIDEKTMKEMMEKAKEVQKKAEEFSKKIVTKFKKDLLGISVVPPTKKDQKEIMLFTLLNDKNILPKDKEPFLKKKQQEAKTLSEGSGYVIDVYLYSEIKQAMFDDNKEVISKITRSLPIYQKNNIMNAFVLPEVHKNMVLEKFEKYVVSYVGVGSILRGEGNTKSDVDVFIIIDDTDVKQMSRMELQDKIRNIVYSMSLQAQEMTKIKIPLHIQTYLLTDFWDMLKESSSPVIYTFLRDGLPFFDRGIYRPWKLLLDMGRIRPSREAVAKHTDSGDIFYQRAKKKLLSVVVEDLYYSVLNPAQSLLMLKGIAPPTHKETVTLFKEIIVQEENLVNKKYADILEEFVKLFKKWEYNEITEMTGSEAEGFMKKADDFRKTLFPIIDKLNYEIYKTKLSRRKNSKTSGKKTSKSKSSKKTSSTSAKNKKSTSKSKKK
ncbi:MAG: nucleotidyltransferase domain-containing protein [Nanobdellota archaeon]